MKQRQKQRESEKLENKIQNSYELKGRKLKQILENKRRKNNLIEKSQYSM